MALHSLYLLGSSLQSFFFCVSHSCAGLKKERANLAALKRSVWKCVRHALLIHNCTLNHSNKTPTGITGSRYWHVTVPPSLGHRVPVSHLMCLSISCCQSPMYTLHGRATRANTSALGHRNMTLVWRRRLGFCVRDRLDSAVGAPDLPAPHTAAEVRRYCTWCPQKELSW